MKRTVLLATTVVLTIVLVLVLATKVPTSTAQGPATTTGGEPDAALGTSITYQGRLLDGGAPVNDTCDLQFGLWNALSGGTQEGITLTVSAVAVSDGRFTAQLDFGDVFAGTAYWLAVAVQCSGDTGYSALTPRQPLTAAPYALYALKVGAHNHLGQTWSGSDNPLRIDGSFGGSLYSAPLVLSNSDASGDGLRVLEAGRDGLYVGMADYGLHVGSVSADGVYVASADGYGYAVASAGNDGFYVYEAGDDGLYIGSTGAPSTTQSSPLHNGVEVAGAEGNGLYVGYAGNTGLSVWETGNFGLYLGETGNDGIVVSHAGGDGVRVTMADGDGVHVSSADGLAGYFDGDVQVTDQLEVNGPAVGFFPRPVYDSGWVALVQGGGSILTHNVGGSLDSYFVDFQCRSGDSLQMPFVTIEFDQNKGAFYGSLSTTTVWIHRQINDDFCPQVRLRIWVIH